MRGLLPSVVGVLSKDEPKCAKIYRGKGLEQRCGAEEKAAYNKDNEEIKLLKGQIHHSLKT